ADARVLQLDGGHLRALPGFDELPGREKWHAVGSRTPYVRSMTATAEGTILANAHVGGIARSTDGGATWFPTIDVDHDVHEVRAPGPWRVCATACPNGSPASWTPAAWPRPTRSRRSPTATATSGCRATCGTRGPASPAVSPRCGPSRWSTTVGAAEGALPLRL